VSHSSDRAPVSDALGALLARILTACQVLAIVAILAGLAATPSGDAASARSFARLATSLGVGALMVGPFLALAAAAAATARRETRLAVFALAAVLVALGGAALAGL
jgi:hypothetical protein